MIETRDAEYWKREILTYDKNVFKAFKFSDDRIELSENMLNGMRDFCESVGCFVYKTKHPTKKFENRYDEIEHSLSYCNSVAELNFISIFHDYLSASIGHKRFYGEFAERLTLKYIDYLIKIKEFLMNSFNVCILDNLNIFPFDMDDSFKKYYVSIAKLLDKKDIYEANGEHDTFYICKKKLIYIEGTPFYEYTLINAIDRVNKSNRFLVFSLLDIPTNYALKLSIIEKELNYFGVCISCSIITSFQISIRPCEINKIGKIVGLDLRYSKTSDYWRLMDYLKNYNTNITSIIKMNEMDYKKVFDYLFQSKRTALSTIFELCRKKYVNNVTGINTLLYLLYRINNVIIKKQFPENSENKLSTMYMSKDTYSFEKSPFSSGLKDHVPQFTDLVNIFNFEDHKEEYFAKKVATISCESGCIYIDESEFNYNKIDDLFEKYNSQYDSDNLLPRKILKYGKNYYLNSNELNTVDILKKIKEYSTTINFVDYEGYAKAKIKQNGMNFDDSVKEKALKNLFKNGSIYVIYGPAGTGKSYFASLALEILDGLSKVCIAATNPAVDNMRRRFKDKNAHYMTITKYLHDYCFKKIDILVIDECSAVSAQDMHDILFKTSPKLILLLGDYFQIQSIAFGNWFALLREIISSKYYADLDNQFRTESEILKPFWKEVRNLSSTNLIIEQLSMNEISHKFDSSIFVKKYKDEIVLCLNYDGLFGINNFNKVLQKNNPEKEYRYKQYIFKKGDPIIFEDTLEFRGLFYNNLKGEIIDIEEDFVKFKFTIKVDNILDSISCNAHNVKFIEYTDDDKTIISFDVMKISDSAYDEDTDNVSYIPFQIAYAMSIHKAQGLEYDSVKVVISNEVEEIITHNIFYTAITRARKHLTIYWTSETEKKVIDSFRIRSYKKDASIIKSKFPELKKM